VGGDRQFSESLLFLFVDSRPSESATSPLSPTTPALSTPKSLSPTIPTWLRQGKSAPL
jgi:hypothetical protein